MRNYILALLLSAFVFITVHDFIIDAKDYDTQTELILEANGQLDFEQMCKVSQLHDSLHEMLLAPDLVPDIKVKTEEIKTNINLFHTKYIIDFIPQSLYRPPIA